MAEAKHDVMYKKKYLETIANVILNNEHLSDVTFVVNKKQYHASRIHMSAASEVFASLLNEHFANTTDKELVITNIKNNASFFNILQYIHGIELNLTTMSKRVLCELTHLAERFKLAELHDDLKAHLSTIKRFKMNSVVFMLNTARIYNLTKLYDKLKEYVYQHAEQIVNHESFVMLKYDVMIDLLKSNWLYAEEIDILRAALNWHDENIMDVGKDIQPNNENIHVEMEFHSEDPIDEDVDSEDDSRCEIAVVEDFLSKYSDGLFDSDTDEDKRIVNEVAREGKKSETCETVLGQAMNQHEEIDKPHNNSVDKSEIRGTVANEGNMNHEIKTDDPSQRMDVSNETSTLPVSETDQVKMKVKTKVERFSENILTKVLEQIRFSRIQMFEFVTATDTELFKKYKDSIKKKQFDKWNNEPRDCWKYTTNCCSRFVFKIKDIKKFKDSSKENRLYSQDICSVNHMSWSVYAENYKHPETSDEYMGLYLQCKSERKGWKVNASYQLTLLRNDPFSGKHDFSLKSACNREFKTDSDWGWTQFVKLSTLFDTNNQYVKDDTIRVEASVKIISAD